MDQHDCKTLIPCYCQSNLFWKLWNSSAYFLLSICLSILLNVTVNQSAVGIQPPNVLTEDSLIFQGHSQQLIYLWYYVLAALELIWRSACSNRKMPWVFVSSYRQSTMLPAILGCQFFCYSIIDCFMAATLILSRYRKIMLTLYFAYFTFRNNI